MTGLRRDSEEPTDNGELQAWLERKLGTRSNRHNHDFVVSPDGSGGVGGLLTLGRLVKTLAAESADGIWLRTLA